MGILDSLESMVSPGQPEQDGNPNAKVAGGLMAALEEHSGGLQGMMEHMQRNGVDTQAASTGQQMPQQQVNQGLQGSGMIENVAARAGVSPQVAEMALATVLPMVMSHFTQGGTTAPPQGGFGSMASVIMGKFL